MSSSYQDYIVSGTAKRKRTLLSLETKLEILRRCDAGEGPATVGRAFNLGESTIRNIRNNADKIRGIGTSSQPHAAKLQTIISRGRKPLMDMVEKMLSLYIEHEMVKGSPLSISMLQSKAVKIYEHLCREYNIVDPVPFQASKKWWGKFIKRYKLQDSALDPSLQATNTSACSDRDAVGCPDDGANLPAEIEVGEASSCSVLPGLVVDTGLEEDDPGDEDDNEPVAEITGSSSNSHAPPAELVCDERFTMLSSPSTARYQLRHNNHLQQVLHQLAADDTFMDVTLTAEGKQAKAHKSVLSAVSPFFSSVLKDNPCQHTIIVLPSNVRFHQLTCLISYIYRGEVSMPSEELLPLLEVARQLAISGLGADTELLREEEFVQKSESFPRKRPNCDISQTEPQSKFSKIKVKSFECVSKLNGKNEETTSQNLSRGRRFLRRSVKTRNYSNNDKVLQDSLVAESSLIPAPHSSDSDVLQIKQEHTENTRCNADTGSKTTSYRTTSETRGIKQPMEISQTPSRLSSETPSVYPEVCTSQTGGVTCLPPNQTEKMNVSSQTNS